MNATAEGEEVDVGGHSEAVEDGGETAVQVTGEDGFDLEGNLEEYRKPVRKQFTQTMEEVGITDNLQASLLLEIMTKAKKTMATKDEGVFEVADWPTRLAALKLSLQGKGHLKEREERNDDLEGKIFVFAPKTDRVK